MAILDQAVAASDFISYLNSSPTPFHAVHSAKQRLTKAGFKEIKEKESWSSSCQPGGKYYLTRNGSTLVAFAIGKKWKPGNPISMIGAHTDSCCLRLKPVSKKQAEGFMQVGVETYGGGLWHTWFDRDLGLAGRAMVREANGSIVQKLVHIDKPILRIPSLAVHLDRQDPFSFNKETQLFPIAGLVAAELKRVDALKSDEEDKSNDTTKQGTKDGGNEDFRPLQAMTQRHHPHIVELIAAEAGVEPDQVVDFEMLLYDTQKACIGGLLNEFIFGARLDNLGMTYCATMGLIRSVAEKAALEDETAIRLISIFDNEEIGSQTAQGADSSMLPHLVRRLSVLPSSNFSESDSEQSYDKAGDTDVSTAYEQSLACSFLVSADMAHSINPNYGAKYEADHHPEMNKGPVIKINANARYATTSPGIVLIEEMARMAGKGGEDGVPLQLLVARNDSNCGSTIGPMLSAKLGARTLDLGNSQLAMHSIRETSGTMDVHHSIRLFTSFFHHYSALEKTIFVD